MEKSLIHILFFCSGIIVLTWYLKQSSPPTSNNIIEVDRNTWDIISKKLKGENKQNEELKVEINKNVLKRQPSPSKLPQKAVVISQKAVVMSQKAKTMSYTEKEKWIFELLRNSRNLKSGPKTQRDSSYSIITDGVRKPPDESAPMILVWWSPEFLVNAEKNLLERDFQGVCGKCRLTTDRSELYRSNVILFDNIPTKSNLRDLPPPAQRRPEQAYVLWHRETPAKTIHLKQNMIGYFDTMFNYTLSYRKDSDIYWYLGNVDFARLSLPIKYRKIPNEFVDVVIKSKRHLAVWVVSNCNNTTGAAARLDYVQKLVDGGLAVDRFGKCFQRELPRRNINEFLLPYKFYLAFENSWHCKDYLTEKFWRNGLMSNLVPVLWGPSRDDVAALAPPKSYIHVEDFESSEKLIKYLKYLDENEAEYRTYFDWRLDPVLPTIPINVLRPGYETPMCKICRALNENNGVLPQNNLPSSIEWVFIDGEDSKCLSFELKTEKGRNA